MDTAVKTDLTIEKKPLPIIIPLIAATGFLVFIGLALGSHPEKAWLIFLNNFLFFTAISLGALLFSTMMHFTKARWSHNLAAVAESFSAFFPVSLVLFLLLLLGRNHLFPWIGEDLHGKEVWLNVPFLFSRDLAGFIILYALGFTYLYHSLWFRLQQAQNNTKLKRYLFSRWERVPRDPETMKKRMTLFAGLYMFAFAIVLSLIGYDLVMSMDPHWYSTLFGAYSFIKAIYTGFGAIIFLTAVLHFSGKTPFRVVPAQFCDLSTLFFGFSIVWGDFFYSQFVVIWYANIPEETSYIIERTMTAPWNKLAWTVFLVCFIMPFLVLLSRKIKQSPAFMIVISALVLAGFWLEYFLLLGPNYLHHIHSFPVAIGDIIISAGFFSLLAMAVITYLRQLPDSLIQKEEGAVSWK